MFEIGQSVVCVDDKFEPWVFDLYKQLPRKGSVYTVRDVSLGRSNPNFAVNDDAEIKMVGADFDILIRLVELVNPDDPHSEVKQELGFRAERFAEALEVSEHVTARESCPTELVPA